MGINTANFLSFCNETVGLGLVLSLRMVSAHHPPTSKACGNWSLSGVFGVPECGSCSERAGMRGHVVLLCLALASTVPPQLYLFCTASQSTRSTRGARGARGTRYPAALRVS
jgi:hypothetical protein